MNPEEHPESYPSTWWVLGPFLGVVALWAISGYAVARLAKNPGTFGDMFGAVNALFSGLAFAGVIYAILLQRRELELQRKELAQTREELRGQKEQMQLQNQTLLQQNFENTFFQLLRLHNDIVNAIDLRRDDGVITKGRDCFEPFYSRFKKRWGRSLAQDLSNVELNRVEKTYSGFYEEVEAELGHYFRSLYNIVKFVDGSNVPNKRLYTNLVRAQLSSFELAMLFYNCLSPLGSLKFRPLVERYALLKTVPKQQLLNPNDHYALYSPTAFAGDA